jgi:hypothetical protein
MMTARLVLPVLISSLLAACAYNPPYNEDSPDTKVPVGSRLTLTRPITIPAGRRSVYIVRGKIVSFGSVDIYNPYCQFRVKKIGAHDQVVQSGTFRVRHTKQWDEYSARPPEVQLAAGGIRSGVGIGVGRAMSDGGPSIISQATILSLASDRQPQVDDMVCQHWGDQGQTPHLTIHQIRTTLAPLFQLQTQAPPPR